MNTKNLISAAQKGDKAAANELIKEYWRIAAGFALIKTSNKEDAEDIAQDALLTAYLNLGKLKNPDLFLPWLKSIIINSLRMFYRRKQRIPELFEDTIEGQKENASLENLLVEDITPEALILQDEIALQLNNTLEKLPARLREVIVLYYFSGLSYKEVSGILDIPITDVTNKLYKAKKIMKEELVDFMENEKDFALQQKAINWVKEVATLIEEGYALARLRNVEGALQIFDKASRLAGESPDAHLYIAESIISLYWLSGRNRSVADKALYENKIALSLGLEGAVHENGSAVDPWEAYANMASIYLQLEDYEKAKIMFYKAKKAGQIYDFNEGSLYSNQGKHDEAIKFYEDLYAYLQLDQFDREKLDMARMCLDGIAYNLRSCSLIKMISKDS